MSEDTTTASRILDVEKQIYELNAELTSLRKSSAGVIVPNYGLTTQEGNTTLQELFGDQDKLLAIHNMGQGCSHCTLWADGFNGLLQHLESVMSVVLFSMDPPNVQRQFANSRGWRFRLASHGGGQYIQEQSVLKGQDNYPGAVLYERHGDEIRRKNSCVFGPGDLYCTMYPILGLAGMNEQDWDPQYRYWQQPQ